MPPLPIGYTKHQWRNKLTSAPYGPVNETRLGEMEQGIEDAHTSLEAIVPGGFAERVVGVVKAGTISDADFEAPVDGSRGVNTNENQLVYRSGGQWYGAVPEAQVPDFAVVATAGTAYGVNKKGAVVFKDSSRDSAAVVHNILNAPMTAGTPGLKSAAGNAVGLVAFGPQTHDWKSVPSLPPVPTGTTPDPGWLTIQRFSIKLSATGQRFADFGKTADHDWFGQLSIETGLIDINNVGGRHHVLPGTYVGGAVTTRISIAKLTYRNITMINGPVDPTTTDHRLGVYLVVAQNDSEPTQDSITDVLIQEVRIPGCNAGFVIGGQHNTNGNALNVLCDRITLRRCSHSLLAVQSSSFSSSNYLIGSRAKGGTFLLEDCDGAYSGDTGFEIDSMTDATLVNCRAVDAVNVNFFHTNFNTPVQPEIATITYRDCISWRIACPTTKAFAFYSSLITGASSVALGTQILDRCSVYVNDGTVGSTAMAIYRNDFDTPPGTFTTRLVVRDFTFAHIVAGTATTSVSAIQIQPTAGKNIVEIDGVLAKISGSYSTGTLTYNIAWLAGAGMNYNVQRVRASVSTSGMTAAGFRLIDVGETAASTIVGRNVIRDCGFISVTGGGTSPFGIIVRSTATLTISGVLLIEDCDFSQTTAGTNFSIDATQLALVHRRGNSYRTALTPAPAGFTGLVTATGKALATAWDSMATFTPLSGAGITAIDYSTNGGSTYTPLLTQAAGPIPAGWAPPVGPLPTDALIKVTWSATTTATGVNALNSATVNVGSTAGYPTAGTFLLVGVPVTYTGITGTSFTGCGNHAATTGGEAVTAPQPTITLAPVNP